jgi:hypothetical protein
MNAFQPQHIALNFDMTAVLFLQTKENMSINELARNCVCDSFENVNEYKAIIYIKEQPNNNKILIKCRPCD